MFMKEQIASGSGYGILEVLFAWRIRFPHGSESINVQHKQPSNSKVPLSHQTSGITAILAGYNTAVLLSEIGGWIPKHLSSSDIPVHPVETCDSGRQHHKLSIASLKYSVQR
jgi:hypothetical protein